MGYSLSVKFKNEQKKDNMKKFILSQTDILDDMDFLEHNYSTNSHTFGDMTSGYNPRQKIIKFN